MAGGGIVGGILLAGLGPASFPWSVLLLMVPVLVVVIGARTHGFPTARRPTAAPVDAEARAGESHVS